MRDQALLPSTLPADAVRQRSVFRSVSRQALSILINHSRCLDHIAKCSPRSRISAAFTDFGARLFELQRRALRVPTDFPATSLGFLRRAPSLFGAGARPVMTICDDAYAGALTATWSHLTTLLRDPNPARLVLDLRAVAVRLQQEHTALRDTFDADTDLDDLALRPCCGEGAAGRGRPGGASASKHRRQGVSGRGRRLCGRRVHRALAGGPRGPDPEAAALPRPGLLARAR